MSSRKEEERNEKIIRGLMKLPPNRRCINCNSLGPQYVCTNFWTFVCMVCSGIHREFTHRVKSVSMAKFTREEVEALQNGGNQRAREIFLKSWDMQQMRLPDSSKPDKVREFIKNVYVEKKFAGGRSYEKPPRDMQSLKNHDDSRRASSYHSYSQSPPYDHQYEDRRYGKQSGMLTRKPGSDRGHYEGKFSSFMHSPGSLREQIYEDRFANESAGSRISDYSVSSTGDPLRFDGQSPNFQDSGYTSPSLPQLRDVTVGGAPQMLNQYSDPNLRRNIDGIAHSKRTASSSSFGSFDSNSMSLKSVNSVSLVDVILEPDNASRTQQLEASSVPSFTQSSASVHAPDLDLFNVPFVQASFSAPTPSVDLFSEFNQQSASTIPEQKKVADPLSQTGGWATFDLPCHARPASEISTGNSGSVIPCLSTVSDKKTLPDPLSESGGWATFDLPPGDMLASGTSTGTSASVAPGASLIPIQRTLSVPSSGSGGLPAFDLLPDVGPAIELSTGITASMGSGASSIPEQKALSVPASDGGGWAAFDFLQDVRLASETTTGISAPVAPGAEVHKGNIDAFSSICDDSQWSSSQTFDAPGLSPLTGNQWNKGSSDSKTSQSWNAFDASTGNIPHILFDHLPQNVEVQISIHQSSTSTALHSGSKVAEDSMEDGFQTSAANDGVSNAHVPFGDFPDPARPPSVLQTGVSNQHRMSTNPFDITYDPEAEQDSTFVDMSSLQNALPNPQPAFRGTLAQPFFPNNSVNMYIPSVSQEGLPYIGTKGTASQLPNVPLQGPVASLGRNPFA